MQRHAATLLTVTDEALHDALQAAPLVPRSCLLNTQHAALTAVPPPPHRFQGELLNDERVNGIIAKAEGAGPAPGAKGGRAANGDQAHPSGGGVTLQSALGGGGTRSAAGSGAGRAAAGPAGTLGRLSQPPDGGFTIPAHNFRVSFFQWFR